MTEQRDGASDQSDLTPLLAVDLQWLRIFIALHGVMLEAEHFLEATMNLAQFPEDQNKNNHDYEQQEWDVHLVILGS